jgi:hypothetical protein
MFGFQAQFLCPSNANYPAFIQAPSFAAPKET